MAGAGRLAIDLGIVAMDLGEDQNLVGVNAQGSRVALQPGYRPLDVGQHAGHVCLGSHPVVHVDDLVQLGTRKAREVAS